jgi:hypothetical protein
MPHSPSDHRRRIAHTLLIVATVLVGVGQAGAQEPEDSQGAPAPPGGDGERLAQQLSNPVADLVSVPIQYNWDAGVGYQDGTRTVLNIQPVVPFDLNDDWNLIGRWIMPFVSQPSLAPGLESTFGLSDILFSAFFSPKSSDLIWGVGPAVSLPSTDDALLGTGKWAAGPTVVILKQNGPWTYGVLANQLWSFADATDAERADVDRLFIQPFLAHQRGTVTYTVQSEATYDREAADGDEWTVPINFVVSKVTQFGPFPMSIAGGYGYFAEAPGIGPERKLRITFTLILPRQR